MNKPCQNCEFAIPYNFKNIKRTHYTCIKSSISCEKHEKYLKHLQAKRKYKKGTKIISIADLLLCEFVWLYCRPTHIEMIKSMQFRTVFQMLNNGNLFEAVLKEERKE